MKSMKCEIISIGSELTSGQNLDTNCQWLSRRLAEMGLATAWHTTVADDLEDNVAAVQIASRRAGVVLITGGLGPTQDDLTREALARAAGVDLVFDPTSWEQIRQMFARRNRPMPERNRVQAMFPAAAEPIPNDHGTAPGIWMKLGEAVVAAMPGVPSEMYAMFEDRIKPRLQALGLGGGVLLERKINCFGSGESHIEEKLFDLTRRGHVPEVGITASDAVISLRIFGRGPSPAEAEAQIAPVEITIRERLGSLVFGTGDEELHDVVGRLLVEKRLTLSTAESVTGGMVAERLVRVAGASAWFRGGVVAYQNDVKVGLLGVPAELIARHDVISGPVVEAMAAGCRRVFHSDLAVATVGLAGPGGGTPEKPVGLVYIAVCSPAGCKTERFVFSGDREAVRARATAQSLHALRRLL